MKLAMNYRRAFLFATTHAEAFLAWHAFSATLARQYAERGDRQLARFYGGRSRYWFQKWFEARKPAAKEKAA